MVTNIVDHRRLGLPWVDGFLTGGHWCGVYESRPHDCRGYMCWNQPDETVYEYVVFLQNDVAKLRERGN